MKTPYATFIVHTCGLRLPVNGALMSVQNEENDMLQIRSVALQRPPEEDVRPPYMHLKMAIQVSNTDTLQECTEGSTWCSCCGLRINHSKSAKINDGVQETIEHPFTPCASGTGVTVHNCTIR